MRRAKRKHRLCVSIMLRTAMIFLSASTVSVYPSSQRGLHDSPDFRRAGHEMGFPFSPKDECSGSGVLQGSFAPSRRQWRSS